MKEKMEVQDIIKKSDFVQEAGVDWKEIYQMLANLLETPEWRLMRTNNTLFLLNMQDAGTASVTVFDAGETNEFPAAIQEFLRACKHAEINHIIFNAKGRYVQQLIRRMGYKIEETALTQDENGVTMYQGDVYV